MKQILSNQNSFKQSFHFCLMGKKEDYLTRASFFCDSTQNLELIKTRPEMVRRASIIENKEDSFSLVTYYPKAFEGKHYHYTKNSTTTLEDMEDILKELAASRGWKIIREDMAEL